MLQTLAKRDVWDEIYDFMNTFHTQAQQGVRVRTPFSEVHELDNEFAIFIDLPGVKKENLDIVQEKDFVTISGKVVRDIGRENETKLECRFKMPNFVKRDEIRADLKDGVLKILIPKSEYTKSRKIPIS